MLVSSLLKPGNLHTKNSPLYNNISNIIYLLNIDYPLKNYQNNKDVIDIIKENIIDNTSLCDIDYIKYKIKQVGSINEAFEKAEEKIREREDFEKNISYKEKNLIDFFTTKISPNRYRINTTENNKEKLDRDKELVEKEVENFNIWKNDNIKHICNYIKNEDNKTELNNQIEEVDKYVQSEKIETIKKLESNYEELNIKINENNMEEYKNSIKKKLKDEYSIEEKEFNFNGHEERLYSGYFFEDNQKVEKREVIYSNKERIRDLIIFLEDNRNIFNFTNIDEIIDDWKEQLIVYEIKNIFLKYLNSILKEGNYERTQDKIKYLEDTHLNIMECNMLPYNLYISNFNVYNDISLNNKKFENNIESFKILISELDKLLIPELENTLNNNEVSVYNENQSLINSDGQNQNKNDVIKYIIKKTKNYLNSLLIFNILEDTFEFVNAKKKYANGDNEEINLFVNSIIYEIVNIFEKKSSDEIALTNKDYNQKNSIDEINFIVERIIGSFIKKYEINKDLSDKKFKTKDIFKEIFKNEKLMKTMNNQEEWIQKKLDINFNELNGKARKLTLEEIEKDIKLWTEKSDNKQKFLKNKRDGLLSIANGPKEKALSFLSENDNQNHIIQNYKQKNTFGIVKKEETIMNKVYVKIDFTKEKLKYLPAKYDEYLYNNYLITKIEEHVAIFILEITKVQDNIKILPDIDKIFFQYFDIKKIGEKFVNDIYSYYDFYKIESFENSNALNEEEFSKNFYIFNKKINTFDEKTDEDTFTLDAFDYPFSFTNNSENYPNTINNKNISDFDLTKYSKKIQKKELGEILNELYIIIGSYGIQTKEISSIKNILKNNDININIDENKNSNNTITNIGMNDLKFIYDYISNILELIKNINNTNNHLTSLYDICKTIFKNAPHINGDKKKIKSFKSTEGFTKNLFTEFFTVVKILINQFQ